MLETRDVENLGMAGSKRVVLAATSFVFVVAGVEPSACVADAFKGDLDRRQEAAPQEWFVHSLTMGWKRNPGYEGSLGLADREF